MIMEQMEEEIGFPAPPYTGHNFDQTVFLLADQLVEIHISLDFHQKASIPRIGAKAPDLGIYYILKEPRKQWAF